jgi:hypothetical protein
VKKPITIHLFYANIRGKRIPVRSEVFPRWAERGSIEAAVGRLAISRRSPSPRSTVLCLVEAQAPLAKVFAKNIFPRSAERGSIEASFRIWLK